MKSTTALKAAETYTEKQLFCTPHWKRARPSQFLQHKSSRHQPKVGFALKNSERFSNCLGQADSHVLVCPYFCIVRRSLALALSPACHGRRDQVLVIGMRAIIIRQVRVSGYTSSYHLQIVSERLIPKVKLPCVYCSGTMLYTRPALCIANFSIHNTRVKLIVH